MTDYTKTTDFSNKDGLPIGNPGKIIRGSEFDTEFNNIQTASATKSNIISPTFVGTVTTPALSVTGTATATAFVGDGAGLTNLPSVAASTLQQVTTVGATTTDSITTGGLVCNGPLQPKNPSGATDAIAIGNQTGTTNQGVAAISIGALAGNNTQGSRAVAVGNEAGSISQGNRAVAVGNLAGQTTQGSNAVAVGIQAGQTSQGTNAVAVGDEAGSITQGNNAVAVGVLAGNDTQGASAVAVGDEAGSITQGEGAVAVGNYAGQTTQGTQATAVGFYAGRTTQGDYAVAMGYSAGGNSQGANGIILNATGVTLDNTSTGHIHVASSEGELKFTSAGGWAMIDGGVTNLAVSPTGTVTATAFVGDGSGLTNLPAGSPTNLTNTATTSAFTVNSSTGTNTSLPAATTSAWGVMTDEDKTKLNGIETGADVTDATNVSAAGALMDSELTSIASVKALNQGVATSNSPSFVDLTLSGDPVYRNVTGSIASADVTFSTAVPSGGADGDIWYQY